MTDAHPLGDAAELAIEVRGLTRRFGARIAVDDVWFGVERGAIFGLLGPNGSGKSTILRTLLGILPPSAGSAVVLGYDCAGDAEAIKQRVGYMSQQFSLYADLSVQENIDFYGRVYGLSPQRLEERREAVLQLTSVGARLHQLAGTLSGGWKQRLALACALIHEPEILFLDEPTAGIDPVARRQLWDLLFDLSAQDVTLLVTTHSMDEAERCTDVGYLYMSRMLVLGKPDDLKLLPSVTPQGTARYELRLPRPAEQLRPLRALDGIRDATLFGETIHVLADATTGPADWSRQLDIPPAMVEVREATPTLEDVFVSLTRQAESLAGAASTHREGPPLRKDDPPPGIVAEKKTVAARPQRRGPTHPTRPRDMASGSGWRSALAIMGKEFVHIRRQPSTLFFMLVTPVMQTIIFGYAINMQIEHIPLAVFDLDGRRSSRELVEMFANTHRFDVVEQTQDEHTLRSAITSGRAKVGLIIPPNYSDRMVRGEQAYAQVLIDGSDSQVATTALNTAQLLGLNLSIRLARAQAESFPRAPARDALGAAQLPVELRPRLLYNPDLESARFFVPGLVGIILQLVTLFLTSFAIVRERELGTLEQLFVTPVSRQGLLLGKLVPYAVAGFVETLIVLTVMIFLFGVPIRGSVGLLLILATLFMVCSLSLGLLVSTIAKTQLAAMQAAFVIMLPSVLLSGFVFPRSQMPAPIYWASFALPATYFIEILRGIVLRGADLSDLLAPVAGLGVCLVFVASLSVARFRKQY